MGWREDVWVWVLGAEVCCVACSAAGGYIDSLGTVVSLPVLPTTELDS